MRAKKIVYLIGAGAIQAEIDHIGVVDSDITMEGISKNIYELSASIDGRYSKLVDEFGVEHEQDVELMMSLFEGYTKSEGSAFSNVYEELRKLFREYLLSQITKKVIKPRLLSALIYINKNYGEYMGESGETTLGVLTTNYDSLLEEAFSEVFKGLNCGYEFKSNNYNLDDSIPPLLKLHGSFNWRIQGSELQISKEFETEEYKDNHKGWLPPSVYKKPPQGICSTIWEKARELLIHCDILRVVGSSLRNEDLALLSLIFTSQITSEKHFDIELILPEKEVLGDEKSPGIMNRLPFLTNIHYLKSLPLFDQEDFIEDKNVFRQWLLKKIEEAEEINSEITNDPGIVGKFGGG